MKSCWFMMLFWSLPLWAVEVSIGSYNVENLWDADALNTVAAWESFLTQEESNLYHPEANPQYLPFSSHHSNWYNPAIAAQKAGHILHAIRLSGAPDVFALQEIESAGNASRVFDISLPSGLTLRQELQQMGYVSFLIGRQDPQKPVSTTTAFISKLLLIEKPSISIRFERPSFAARDLQVVEVEDTYGDLGRVVLINVHWKALGSKKSKKLQKEAAKSLKRYIDEVSHDDPSSRVIVLGDFNASYWDNSLQELSVTGSPAKENNRELYDLWFELPKNQRWDSSFQGVRNHLSHMLIGNQLLQGRGLSYKPGSFLVVGQNDYASKFLLSAQGTPFRWQYKVIGDRKIGYYEHLGVGYSDHLPIVATFETHALDVDLFDLVNRADARVPIPQAARVDQVEPCRLEEVRDYKVLDFTNPKKLEGTCVRIEPSDPMPFWIDRGGYPTVTFPDGLFMAAEKAPKVAVTMVRSHDYRPNINDSRVSLEDWVQANQGRWSVSKPHPQSNLCFVRNVLKSGQGRLKKAVGRLGYTDGGFHIHVLSREPEHLQIVDLPEELEKVCSWL
ncbi:MAG: hypothetical protein AB8C84_13400 [Oligoflexales bacterium]